jgi:AhpD family alkylhydroperoxidase
MARIPFADPEAPDIADLSRQIAAERGSVLALYRMLLHSPPMAAGWLKLLTAVRQEGRLPGALRELVIMRVAALNGASYEAAVHAGIALKEGLTQAQLEDIVDWRASPRFDRQQRAVLAYVDAVTREIQVPDEVFSEIRNCFDHRGIVELTVTVSAYNMVSRFLEALAIHAQ